LSLLVFLGKRILSAVVTFFIITFVVYGFTLVVPVRDRAMAYFPPNPRGLDTEEKVQRFLDNIIEEYGLDDPLPVQYTRWLNGLAHGDWGYSPTVNTEVLPSIVSRSPATLELTFVSILLYIPLGLLIGTFIAWRQGRLGDRITRFFSYAVAAIPPFILGLMLISVVYVQLGLFDLSRISYREKAVIQSEEFSSYTGFITVDGILNGRLDITWQAIRHLVLPVVTLSALHLASITLVTRVTVLEQLQQEYVLMAKGMGLRRRRILFRYALNNAMVPVLTHSALTAAQVITGVYVIEAIFNWHGVSELLTLSLGGVPDVNLALGFSTYSIMVVLSMVLLLDIAQAAVDPRVREGAY